MDEIADALERALTSAENDLRLEQAVYGLDAMKEVALQQLLADQLQTTGYADVKREVHYPSDLAKKRSGRRRCDFVLTPPGRVLHEADAVDLFTPDNVCPPEEALWLELKLVHQFAEGGRRHGGYGQQWREATVKDLRKIESEPRVREAALVLLAFTAGDAVIDKDLELFEDVLARKEVLAGFRQVRRIELLERNGHTRATVALWPTIQRGTD
ncbi:MAG: hypothetical protein AAGK78_03325 [Planctomycetota bacterium]